MSQRASLSRNNGAPLDSVDLILLRRLNNVGIPLRAGELADDDRLEATEDEVRDRLQRLEAAGYVARASLFFTATVAGSALSVRAKDQS